MPAKPKKPSPAQQRASEKAISERADCCKQKDSDWTPWDRKVDRIVSRDLDDIVDGWLANIPTIYPPGSPPRESFGSIYEVYEALPHVPKKGDKVVEISCNRSAVLHESLYLINKSIHVLISCTKHASSGNHTWAVVDSYQASLFALGGIMSFLGLTVERSDNNFILIDVWADPPSDKYRFIRFKSLDHFHKWAILKRLLRTLNADSRLLVFVSEGIQGLDEKSFAKHRNEVFYKPSGWLADDLIRPNLDGPIKLADNSQHLYDEIYGCSTVGTVYLMCALIELACEFADRLFEKGVLQDEKKLLDRRHAAMTSLAKFDWSNVTSSESI